MRILIILIVGCFIIPATFAESPLKPITDLSEFSVDRGSATIGWNNQRPDQKNALSEFYRSMNQSASPSLSIDRQQHAQELRRMNPQQRQQLFLNYIQQNR
ncbi:MAG: hypothetical protein ACI910_000735 [Oleispira sp.]|jgi:hypothetical protein